MSDDETHTPDKYNKKLIKSLSELRKQNQLCDITINMGGRAFHAHKNVLGARSSYFLTMFTSSFKESWEKEISVDGNAEVFDRLLDFMYTGKATLKPEIAGEFLQMACYMQVTEAIDFCWRFIEDAMYHDKLSMDVVVQMYHLAKFLGYGTTDLYNHMFRYHLEELKSSKMFLETFDSKFLEKLLTQTYFSGEKREKEVFAMIISWLKFDWENRRQYASSLLQLVRLGQVPEEKLIELMDEDILGIPECKLLLDQTLEALHSTCSKYQRIKQLPNLFATRSTITAPVTIGLEKGFWGDPKESTKKSEVYYYNKLGWSTTSQVKALPYIPSLIMVDDQLYAAGGYETVNVRDMQYSEESDEDDGYYGSFYRRRVRRDDKWRAQRVNNFSRYNRDVNRWDKLPPMKDDRSDVPLVPLDGFLYAIGGVGHKDKILNHVERFNMKDLCWERQAPLPEGYKWVSAVPFHGSILAYGLKESTHMIAMYNPDVNVWQIKSKLTVKGKCDRSGNEKDPILFVHKDVCYRVLFQQATKEESKNIKGESKYQGPGIYLLVVNTVKMQAMSTGFCNCPNHPKKNTMVSIGEEVKQDRIPANKSGAFRIDSEVFVSLNRCVHLTDISVEGDDKGDVSLGAWDRLFWDPKMGMHSSVVILTFDPQRYFW